MRFFSQRSRPDAWSWNWLPSIFLGCYRQCATFVRERATKHGINLEVSIDERLGDYMGDELATMWATSARSSRFFLICYPTP
jgi:hypothetical protein